MITPLEYAKLVIESYEADMRHVRVVDGGQVQFRGSNGKSLAELGVCQGSIYTGAMMRIAELGALEDIVSSARRTL